MSRSNKERDRGDRCVTAALLVTGGGSCLWSPASTSFPALPGLSSSLNSGSKAAGSRAWAASSMSTASNVMLSSSGAPDPMQVQQMTSAFSRTCAKGVDSM
eukprot:scaffold550445_cov31-Prasinocladus_malaysianus.AAC.1